MLCLDLSVAWVTCRYSQVGEYYNYSHNKMMEGKMVTEQGYGMGIGGCDELSPAAMGHGLVTLFSLSMSIEDRTCVDWLRYIEAGSPPW